MASDTKTIIREHFNELPPVVQDVVLNSNWEGKIRRIVTNHNLHIDQGAAIENLVFVTMLGMETPDEFIQNAREYAHVDDDTARTIAQEVEREIFGEIRKKLVDITETADTVDDIGRVTDELSKVADDITARAQADNEPLVLTKKNEIPTLNIQDKKISDKVSRQSLADRIPKDHFKKESSASSDETGTPIAIKKINDDPYHEPITPTDTNVVKEPAKPLPQLDEGGSEETVYSVDTAGINLDNTKDFVGVEALSEHQPVQEKGGVLGIFRKKKKEVVQPEPSVEEEPVVVLNDHEPVDKTQELMNSQNSQPQSMNPNPKQVFTPIPKDLNIAPTINQAGEVPTAPAINDDFFADKLSDTTVTEKETTIIDDQPIQTAANNYSHDPYREPVE